jgi:long-chain fatty acid transport protein
LRLFSRTRVLISALMILACGTALGSGFSIFEQGAKATGMGGAFAATADDPSAIFYNVAGIAQQRHMAFYSGGTLINFTNEFRGDPNDPFASGTTGHYDRHTFIPPNAYAIVPIGSSLTFGIGVTAPFGLRTDWQDPWVGRFVSRDANIKVVSVEPAVAWQNASGSVAVGAGVEYRRARAVLNRNNALPGINPFNGKLSDAANAYLSTDWESGIGWNVGILLKPGTWRFGASYRAPMDIDFNGDVTITQIPTGVPAIDAQVAAGLPPSQGAETTIPFPAIALFGIASSAIPNWDLEFDVTHTSWSRFKTLEVTGSVPAGVTLIDRPQNWEDTMSFRLGANHRVNETWDVRFGAVYDQNPQPAEAVSPLLPDSDRMGVSFGVGFRHGPFTIDVTEFVLHFKDRSTIGVPNTDLSGIYKTDANLISLNLGYRF